MKFTTSNIMQTLWEGSKDHLTNAQIKSLINLTDHAQMQADTLSDALMGIGCTIAQGDESESFKDKERVSNLIFNLSHQVDVLAGLIYVGTRAEDVLKAREV